MVWSVILGLFFSWVAFRFWQGLQWFFTPPTAEEMDAFITNGHRVPYPAPPPYPTKQRTADVQHTTVRVYEVWHSCEWCSTAYQGDHCTGCGAPPMLLF